MQLTPLEILQGILRDPLNAENVRSLVAADATYVSLNFSNEALKRVMPWAGTSKGPDSIVQTFVDVARYWKDRQLEQIATFGDERYAATFGRMTYVSTVLEKQVVSPFCVYVECEGGLCRHMQFMEDTFATTDSFRSGGEWVIRSNPNGEEIRV